MYWVYMIKKGDKLYIGVTQNPTTRLHDHNRKYGAQFTQNNPSFRIVFLEKYHTLADARKKEVQIKKWRRDKKDLLINLYSKGKETKLNN